MHIVKHLYRFALVQASEISGERREARASRVTSFSNNSRGAFFYFNILDLCTLYPLTWLPIIIHLYWFGGASKHSHLNVRVQFMFLI